MDIKSGTRAWYWNLCINTINLIKNCRMSWLHNRPTMPTFLPTRSTKEEITTIDIEACFQEYRTFRGDIHERYYFQEHLVSMDLGTIKKM